MYLNEHENKMILDCYGVLKMIEYRPAMFTGEHSLRSIHTYISGYYQALIDQKIVSATHADEPFFDWIANKLGYTSSTAGWVNMINATVLGFDTTNIEWEEFLSQSISETQHSASIKRFYELLDEFKSQMND